jgi:hypothetical protein
MASKLLKLRTLSTMALICRRSPFAFIIPSTATSTATRASPSVTSVRCLVTADSPVSKPVVTASPLERLRQRQMRDAAKAAARIQPAVKDTTKEAPQLPLSFQGLGLDPELMMAVKELGLAEPTEVQALGIPAVVAGESVVIASHTGSGKTLAYMLPIVQALRRDEVESGKATRPRRPRAVVLCPTRELAEQVLTPYIFLLPEMQL